MLYSDAYELARLRADETTPLTIGGISLESGVARTVLGASASNATRIFDWSMTRDSEKILNVLVVSLVLVCGNFHLAFKCDKRTRWKEEN